MVSLIIIVAVLLVAWYMVQHFSPDPLITKIGQIIIFVIALLVIIQKVLPMAGLSVPI